MEPKSTIIAVVGPTASGKSALGVRLAKRFGGVVASADSRQVYRGLDIGSGKITLREMSGIPHYLLDIASLRHVYTVAQYQRAFKSLQRKIALKTPIFIVGGSPFYVKAALSEERFLAVPPHPRLRAIMDKLTTPQLLAILRYHDPRRARTIDRRNRRRLIRALEIITVTGRPVQTFKWTQRPNTLILGLSLPRIDLYRRIDRRVDARMKLGMVAEVRRLHARGVSWQRLEALGLEYRCLALYLQGKVTRSQAVERLKFDIHAFARRQLTWFRKFPGIVWINTPNQAEHLVAGFLEKMR